MYLILESRWMLRRSDHEVWTREGWKRTDCLREGDEVRDAYGRWVKVVAFT